MQQVKAFADKLFILGGGETLTLEEAKAEAFNDSMLIRFFELPQPESNDKEATSSKEKV